MIQHLLKLLTRIWIALPLKLFWHRLLWTFTSGNCTSIQFSFDLIIWGIYSIYYSPKPCTFRVHEKFVSEFSTFQAVDWIVGCSLFVLFLLLRVAVSTVLLFWGEQFKRSWSLGIYLNLWQPLSMAYRKIWKCKLGTHWVMTSNSAHWLFL